MRKVIGPAVFACVAGCIEPPHPEPLDTLQDRGGVDRVVLADDFEDPEASAARFGVDVVSEVGSGQLAAGVLPSTDGWWAAVSAVSVDPTDAPVTTLILRTELDFSTCIGALVEFNVSFDRPESSAECAPVGTLRYRGAGYDRDAGGDVDRSWMSPGEESAWIRLSSACGDDDAGASELALTLGFPEAGCGLADGHVAIDNLIITMSYPP